LVLIPICIPLLLLRTYKFLAFTSILGDFAVLAGTRIGQCLHLVSATNGESSASRQRFNSSSSAAASAPAPPPSGVTATVVFGASNYKINFDLPAFNAAGIAPAMGNIAFLFLSHIVALPMAQSLKGDFARPTRYHKVVWTSFIVITVSNLLFGT
jgi:hypothetical protein